ncbi:hypothetical protein [Synechococcus sp. UW179A]|uniref:hypothetical protein n=1 Tax=Synechococcus sp. UW179A TaxID=2575510 RepID=UPI0010BE4128|nr:hypothetical protein [Synechococcus sp. UW179A]
MEDTKNIKVELTEDELKGVSGGDGVVTDVPGNPLGSLKEELTEDELKGLSGGAGVVTGVPGCSGGSVQYQPRPPANSAPALPDASVPDCGSMT